MTTYIKCDNCNKDPIYQHESGFTHVKTNKIIQEKGNIDKQSMIEDAKHFCCVTCLISYYKSIGN